jgi:hypothetical protein
VTKGSRLSSVLVYLGYQGVAIVMTWPLVLGIGRDVPGDLGDSLLNLWIIGWGAEHVPRLFAGQITLGDYWNANIFHPEPLALAFSEHLFGQAIQILPVYWLSSNLILGYNLLFLSSFALSGLGMFLLVRDVLDEDSDAGSWIVAAAFIAGLIYAFLPFRVAQVGHIQSLSSQWMPFALYGFRRFVLTNRWPALASGSAALLMQHWSCGYYMVFFAPLVPLWVVHQAWSAGRLGDWRLWAGFGVAAGLVAAGTWPFLALYLEAQRVHGFERPLGEVMRYSADVYSYFSAPGALRLWGEPMQAFPKSEGELFFGLVPMALVVVALGATFLARLKPGELAGPSIVAAAPSIEGPGFSRAKYAAFRRANSIIRIIVRILAVIITLQLAAVILIVFTGGFVTAWGGIPIRATNATRLLINAVAALALLLALSPTARARARDLLRSPVVFAAVAMVFALWMSLGPVPRTRGQLLHVPALYATFYEYVPGFDGLRVPARYAMVAGVFLSIVAGAGAAVVIRRWRSGAVVAASLAALILAEAAFAPMPVNVTWGGNHVQPPAQIEPAVDAPAVYHHLATMPDAKVIAEFPFGDVAWELRYVYYSTVHWKPLVNGYSGVFPAGYKARTALLERVAEYPDQAWRALRDAGTTHVIVHERAFAPGGADVVKQWLVDHFAVEIARFDNGDLLFDVVGAWRSQVLSRGSITGFPHRVPFTGFHRVLPGT